MGKPATAENAAGGARIDMIGVPFDGMGRASGQAGAPEALRAAGLRAVFAPDVIMEPDLVLPGPVAQRAAGSGLLNEQALLQMIDALYRRVRSSLAAGRFPFVYGADCSVLLAAVPALRDVAGRAGLVFVDGHEDATPMDLSTSGEAANMEIALLLGLTGERAPQPLRQRLPALTPDAIAMLGPRDHLFRQAANVPTVAGRVWLRSADEVSTDPAGYAACGATGEVMLAGGLTWQQLTSLAMAALHTGGCAGWSLSIYNPDLDPDHGAARSIVECVARIAPSAARQHPPLR
jgi:arginase